MATFYIDLYNGSDAAAGSFAAPWATVTSGATAARIAPGDEIRISKTPAPVSIGNATWTDLSKTVELATAQNATVEQCETAWTASANVTATASTTRKEGSNAASLAIAAAFTTGLVAYKEITEIDLSAYQRLSFWFRNSVAIAAGNVLKVCLCSDTAGTTIVDTFFIQAVPSVNRYMPLTVVKSGGGNLGASIKSVALYADVDPGTPTILLDNIIACTTSGLCLQSLISKNGAAQGGTEGYYGIQSIVGTTVLLDNDTETLAHLGRGYSGTTETVATYIRETFKTPMCATATATTHLNTITDNGTEGNPITYNYGWDMVADTHNGETFFDGLNGFGRGGGLNISAKNYNVFSSVNAIRYNESIFLSSALNNTFTTISNLNNNTYVGISLNSSSRNTFITISNVNNNLTHGIILNGSHQNTFITISNANNNLNHGITLSTSYNNTLTTMSNVINNINYGLNLSSSSSNILSTISNANYNTQYGIYFNASSNNTIKSLSTTGNSTGGLRIDSMLNFLCNASIAEATEVGGHAAYGDGEIRSYDHDNTPGNHWIFLYQATINLQSTTVYDTNPVSWKTAITGNTRTTGYPVKLKLAEVGFVASKLVTVKAWVKKDHATNIGARLITYANADVGITEQSATKADDTDWQELTITFTPTAKGVTEIHLETWYIAGNSNSYVAPITITQAS